MSSPSVILLFIRVPIPLSRYNMTSNFEKHRAEDPDSLNTVCSEVKGEIVQESGASHDAVFGEMTEDGPNYRNVSWI